MPEAVNPSEPQQNSLFEFDAPEVIEEGMNFYDQPPFTQLTSKIYEELDIPAEAIRGILSTACKSNDVRLMTDEEVMTKLHSAFSNDTYAMYHGSSLRYRISKYIPAERSNDKNIVYRQLYTILREVDNVYPFWAEYISSKKMPQFYKPDGTYIPPTKTGKYYDFTPIPSYAKWVTQKLEREKKLKLSGLEDLLPRSPTSSDELVEETRSSGHHRGWRRWKIPFSHDILPKR